MSFHSASVRALLSRDFDGAAQLLQEIDKAALVCPQPYRAARAIRARGRHAARRSASRWARRRAAVSVAVFSRFAIYANVVGPTRLPSALLYSSHMARQSKPRVGHVVQIRQRPLPFSYWPMYKGTRRYGLQSNVFSTNPWALMKTAVKSECPTHAQAEALACLDQAQQFFGAAVRPDLVAAKPLLLYYAFMNIAKALCLTRSRRATFDQAQHGLSEKLGPGGVELIDAYLKAYPSSPSSPVANVFADFVGTLGGASIAPTYDVVNLMPQIVAGHRLWCDATGNRERFVAIERINIMERSSTKSIWLRVYVYAGDLTRLSVTRRLLLDESRLAGAWLEVSPLEENRRTLLRL